MKALLGCLIGLILACEEEPAPLSPEAPEPGIEAPEAGVQTPLPSPPHALLRSPDGGPIPTFGSVEIREGAEARGELLFEDEGPALPSGTEVQEVLEVESYLHHGPLAAFQVRTEQGDAWIDASNVLMAGVVQLSEAPGRVWIQADPESPVVDQLLDGESIYFDPVQLNPFDGRSGCDDTLVRVFTHRGLEGHARCTNIR